MEATKKYPAPLDAFDTLKDGEPGWTVQGGDPLGGPLLRIWAHMARIQAGMVPPRGIEFILEQILKAAQNNIPNSEKKREGLLLRATETEQISWAMDDYRNGLTEVEVEEFKAIAGEFDRLDLYDLRRRCTTFISNFFSEMDDIRLELIKREYLIKGDFIDHQFKRIEADLRWLMGTIEIKRGN